MKDPIDLPALRVRGSWPLPTAPRVAIVGARRATAYGKTVAERLAFDLVRAGVVVVSGLAVGIDGAAHRGALNGDGCTVAILGSGLDMIYPPQHRDLAEQIVAGGGALISQFPNQAPPHRHNFPRRNWIIAALSQVVVVVEAAESSGALITVDAALALGRQVLSVPGSVFSRFSVGCHQLLRDGAGLVQNADDILAELKPPSRVLNEPLQPLNSKEVTDSEGDELEKLLVDGKPLDPGELAAKVGLPVGRVLSRLSSLELEGKVRRVDGGYVRVHL